MGGETPAHAQREDAPVSVGKPARERQYDYKRGGEWRPDKGHYCTCDIGAVACFSSTSTAWVGTYLWGLTGSIWSGPEPAST